MAVIILSRFENQHRIDHAIEKQMFKREVHLHFDAASELLEDIESIHKLRHSVNEAGVFKVARVTFKPEVVDLKVLSKGGLRLVETSSYVLLEQVDLRKVRFHPLEKV